MRRMRRLALRTIMLSLGFMLVASPTSSQEAKIPRVGVILLGGPGPGYEAIRQGLNQLGYVEHDGREFTLAPRVLELGFGFLATRSWIERAEPPATDDLPGLGHDRAVVAVVAGQHRNPGVFAGLDESGG